MRNPIHNQPLPLIRSLAFVSALGLLASCGVTYSQQQLPPQDLAKQLNADSYQARSQAEQWLQGQGFDAVETLLPLLQSDTPEVAWRASKSFGQLAAHIADPVDQERYLMLVDVLTTAGFALPSGPMVNLRSEVNRLRAQRLLEEVANAKGVSVNAFPVWQQQIIRANGMIIVERPFESPIEATTPPATKPNSDGRDYARENLGKLADQILQCPEDEIADLKNQLRDSKINLFQSDAADTSPDFGVVATVDDTANADSLRILERLQRAVTHHQLTLDSLDLTEERLQWLLRLLNTSPPQQITIQQCQLTASQLSKIESAMARPEALNIHGRAMLGVRASSLVAGPATVSEVTQDSGAEKAGVQVGDVIYEVDGVTVRDFEHLRRIIACHAPGDTVKLAIYRQTGDPADAPKPNVSDLKLNVTLTDYSL